MLLFLLLADALAPTAESTLTGAIVTVVAMVLGALIKYFAKEKAEERMRLVDSLIRLAYLNTLEAAKLAAKGKAGAILDKAAHALELFDTAFEAEGQPAPTAAEKARAQLTWKAFHAHELAAEEAGTVSLATPRPPP